MAKRRMLQWMRERLNSYAKENVAPIVESKALTAAYRKAEPLVRKVVEAKYKPADMEVCNKYGVAYRDACIRMQLSDGAVKQFTFAEEEAAPFVVRGNCNSRMYIADEKTSHAVDAWIVAKETLEAEQRKRLGAYRALIDGSSSLDDVIAVWPEVATLFPPANDLIPLNPEQIALVQADIKERKAA
jgi:hypothetical protein